MTPEQNLWCAVVDRAVEDSLADPIGAMPDYDHERGSKPWKAISEKRRAMSLREYNRLDAKDCLMGSHMESVYMRAHGRSIKPLRAILRVIWDKIEHDPLVASEYRRVFRTAGNRADRRARA